MQDARVASGPVEIAFADGAEELFDEGAGVLVSSIS